MLNFAHHPGCDNVNLPRPDATIASAWPCKTSGSGLASHPYPPRIPALPAGRSTPLYRHLCALEGSVPGALGPDPQGSLSAEGREIQGRLEVPPGRGPVVAQDGTPDHGSPLRVLQDDGVRRLEVAGVPAYGEGVPDPGARAWLHEHGGAAHRRRTRFQRRPLWLKVHHEARRVRELEHPVAERLAREDIDEHAAVWRAHDVEALEQGVAQGAVGDGGADYRWQRYAQAAAAGRAHEGPLRHRCGGLVSGTKVQDHPLVPLVRPIPHREHRVRLVARASARLRSCDERDAGGTALLPGVRGHPHRRL